MQSAATNPYTNDAHYAHAWLASALSALLDRLPYVGIRRRLRRRGATSTNASVF